MVILNLKNLRVDLLKDAESMKILRKALKKHYIFFFQRTDNSHDILYCLYKGKLKFSSKQMNFLLENFSLEICKKYVLKSSEEE
jgi:hypothetical protein